MKVTRLNSTHIRIKRLNFAYQYFQGHTLPPNNSKYGHTVEDVNPGPNYLESSTHNNASALWTTTQKKIVAIIQ